MKSKILGLLAAGLLAGPMGAQAALVQISGFGAADGMWEVTALGSAPFSANQTLLENQIWWGNASLAQTFAELVLDSLGLPNFGNSETPYYAYATLPDLGLLAWICNSDCSFSGGLTTFQTIAYSYAVASRINVPEQVPEPGTLALLGLGLVGIGMRRRIKAS